MSTTTETPPAGFVTTATMDDDSKVTQSIIASQLALNLNEEVKHTNRYRGRLKYTLNHAIVELVKSEKNYDIIFDKAEEACVSTYDELAEAVKEFADLGIHHAANIRDMFRAFKKDPAS